MKYCLQVSVTGCGPQFASSTGFLGWEYELECLAMKPFFCEEESRCNYCFDWTHGPSLREVRIVWKCFILNKVQYVLKFWLASFLTTAYMTITMIWKTHSSRDFRFPPRCKWDVHPSGMLSNRIRITRRITGLLDPWRWNPTGFPETSVTNSRRRSAENM
jgi:hypothetical protein